MLDGVQFGTKHSYDDFGLILKEKIYPFRNQRRKRWKSRGRNGAIDRQKALWMK